MALGYHSRAYLTGPTTLASQDPTSQVNDINTGTANPRGNVHGRTDRFLQRGADDNQAQTSQAIGGYMSGRGTRLIKDQIDRGVAFENREKRRQAHSRLHGESI